MGIKVDRDLAKQVLEEARFAPSAHNVQPTYAMLENDQFIIYEDYTRTLPISDPTGADIRLSHGCFIEGMALALSKRGLRVAEVDTTLHTGTGTPIAVLTIEKGAEADLLAPFIRVRKTWRGAFQAEEKTKKDFLLAPLQAHHDIHLLTDSAAIKRVAELADKASLHFMRDRGHRDELLKWMRLSRRHPDYHHDGMNAEAMGFGLLETIGVPWVLGSLFAPLDSIGFAAKLTTESAITENAAALVFFHRPTDEDILHIGRAFYRAWLCLAAAGLSGRPISVLTDWIDARQEVERMVQLPEGRSLVKIMRIGTPKGHRIDSHARLPVEDILRS